MNILSGVYDYGEVITENRLSEELGVSRTPIREALSRLAQDHLIADSSKGTIVVGITPKDIEDIFEIKRRIEVLAATWVVDNIDEEGLNKLKDILEQQEFYASKNEPKKVRNLDTEFHDVMYSNCDSVVIQSILSPLHKKLLKYRQASLENEDRMSKSVEEHRGIYEAIKKKDKKKVEELMLNHINNAGKNIMKRGK
jgi:DNA-binding GntR family transcriptional regulator